MFTTFFFVFLSKQSSLKCHCSDDLALEQSCTVVGCTSTNKYGIYSTDPDGYEHWADGKPALARSCAAISRIDSNFWVDRSCTEMGSFICQIPATGVRATHKKACFPEEGKCFVLFMEPHDFMGAQRFCEEEGGHMAALNGPTDQLEAERLLLTSAPELTTSNAFNLSLVYTWIGAKNRDYVWPNGDTPNKHRFKNWAPNEPKTELDCVVMNNQLNGFAKFPWKSEKCDKSRSFLLSAEQFTVKFTTASTVTTTATSTTSAIVNISNQALLYTRPPGALVSPVGVTSTTFNTVWGVLLGVIAILLIIIILLVCGCIPGRKTKVEPAPKIDQECQTKAKDVRHVPSQSTPTIVSKGLQVDLGPSQSDEDTMKKITILIEQFFKEQIDKNSELQVNFGVLQQRIDLLTELVKQCKEEKERIEREMMRSSREQEIIVRHDNKEYVEKVNGKVININLQCEQPSPEPGSQPVNEDSKKCAEMEETLSRVYEQQRLLIETLANSERQEPEPLPPYVIYPTPPPRKKKTGRRKKKKRQPPPTISVFDRLHIRQPPCGKKIKMPAKYYLWQSTKQINDTEHPVRITLSPRSLVATSPHRVKVHRANKTAKAYRTTTTTTTRHHISDNKKKFQRKQKPEKTTTTTTSDNESPNEV